jgi:VanZ family protein
MSTQAFGSGRSGSLLANILDLLHVSISANAFWTVHVVLRKLSHLIEYGIFTYLVYRSLAGQMRTRWQPRLAGWSILAAAAYSLFDEFHQALVRGRGASLVDCGIDTIGAVIAVLIVYGTGRGS